MSENDDEIQDIMIRATIQTGTTKQILLDTFEKQGLIGVYNLGLKNMMEYLSEKEKK